MKKERARLVAERIRELVEEIIHLDHYDPQLIDDSVEWLVEALSSNLKKLRKTTKEE